MQDRAFLLCGASVKKTKGPFDYDASEPTGGAVLTMEMLLKAKERMLNQPPPEVIHFNCARCHRKTTCMDYQVVSFLAPFRKGHGAEAVCLTCKFYIATGVEFEDCKAQPFSATSKPR